MVLGGLVPPPRTDRSGEPPSAPRRDPSALPQALPFSAMLGEPHYRRSEQGWREAGEPRARVALQLVAASTLRIDVEVSPSHRLFRAIDAENPYDNEPMAINGDGVQLYLAAGEAKGGWLLVPSEVGTVALHQIQGWGGGLVPTATWRATTSGYALAIDVTLPAGTPELSLDLIANETAPGRERRRGQLVLSGAAGEFVYLRGDRHEPGRLLRFSLADV
jgi:hypothetical protein